MPKLNERAAEDHPWRFKGKRKKADQVRRLAAKKEPWTCPSCGQPDCEFGECVQAEEEQP